MVYLHYPRENLQQNCIKPEMTMLPREGVPRLVSRTVSLGDFPGWTLGDRSLARDAQDGCPRMSMPKKMFSQNIMTERE